MVGAAEPASGLGPWECVIRPSGSQLQHWGSDLNAGRGERRQINYRLFACEQKDSLIAVNAGMQNGFGAASRIYYDGTKVCPVWTYRRGSGVSTPQSWNR